MQGITDVLQDLNRSHKGITEVSQGLNRRHKDITDVLEDLNRQPRSQGPLSSYLEQVPWLRLATCLLDFCRFQRCD